MVADLKSLVIPLAPIPQVDTSWLTNLGNAIGGAIDQAGDTKLARQAVRSAMQQPGQPATSGFLSSLAGPPAVSGGSGAPSSSTAVNLGTPNQIESDFLGTVKNGYDGPNGKVAGITNPFALAAVASTGRAESGWSPQNAGGTWNDGKNDAGGIMSWNGPRLAALQAANGGSNGTAQQQAAFFLQENPELIQRLNNAKSVDEAQNLMNDAWRFKNYNVPGNGRAAQRLAFANAYLPQFQTSDASPAATAAPTQVASLDPSAGMPAPGAAAQMQATNPAPAPTAGALRGVAGNVVGNQNAQGAGYVDPQVTTAASQSAGPMQPSQPSTIDPQQQQQTGPRTLAAGVSPIAPKTVDPDVIARMLANPRMRDVGIALWKQNAGQATAEPWQFVTLPDGTLGRGNRQTGELQTLGQFSKPQALISVPEGDTLVDPSTQKVVYQGQKPQFRQLTPDEVETRGLDKTKAWQVGPDQKVSQIGGNGVTVNTGDNSDKFTQESDKAAAGRLNDIVTAGNSAPQMMDDLQSLASLGQKIGTGKQTEVLAAIGPYAQALGIDVNGLGETQAYQAITARLVPQMRPPGSGPQTDADARNLLNSIPTIGKTPEGNRIIIQTMQRIQENKLKAADIASRAFLPADQGGIKWQEAERQIRQLADPYAAFRAYTKDAPADEQQSSGPVQIRGLDDYQALPKGTQYLDPNGKLRTKQ